MKLAVRTLAVIGGLIVAHELAFFGELAWRQWREK